ncbi:MAG TPA: heparan-alpha-glucosaminide N-acetyltransferase domain-containing protein [Candidatus Binataceae bacterium]|nr:heparan-alpha-glucosaminide N-acetyltransferase domain-containing protein [Candidatus Binataceae bacterium]
MSSESSSESIQAPAPRSRLVSIDVVRGIDMFWIIGAQSLVEGLRSISHNGAIRFVADQFEHKPWEGFHLEDLGLPMFIFIVGVAIVFSVNRSVERTGRGATTKRIFRRSILLYLLGVLYYGGFSTPFRNIRLLGVLQRIAICYLAAALLFCWASRRLLVAICVMLLVGYWALMTFVPVPGVGRANFAEGKNLANYIDKQYLPLRQEYGDHDPEGLLSTLPAVATCLIGVFAGLLLSDDSVNDQTKVFYLVSTGIVGIALGWLWGLQFPVIKKIWTSSFVLVAGGYSALLMGIAYQVLDIWQYQRWAQPFIWIGVNPITIYLAVNLIDFSSIAQLFVGGDVNHFFGAYGQLVLVATTLAIELLLLYFLYRRKIFLSV